MAVKKEQIILEIATDARGAVKGVKTLTGEMKKLEKAAKTNQQAAGKMRKAWDVLKKGWLAITAVIAGVVVGLGKAVKASSRLQEATSKFQTVFKDQIKAAERFAAVLTASYGQSRREAVQFLSSIQDTLVPMGVAADKAADMSFEITKLATDLGSFNDQPTETVIQNIQSALVGNTETVRKYGIVLTQARIQQEAVNLGLIEAGEKLDAATKAQVSFSLIMKDSKAAVGDFARTSDGFANTVKTLKSRIEDQTAALGDGLLPALTGAARAAADFLTPSEKLRLSATQTAQAQLAQADATLNLIGRYKELRDNSNRSAEENEEFRKVSEQIAKITPSAAGGIDKMTGAYKINVTAAENAAKANSRYSRSVLTTNLIEASKAVVELQEAIFKQEVLIEDADEQLRKLTAAYRSVADGSATVQDALTAEGVAWRLTALNGIYYAEVNGRIVENEKQLFEASKKVRSGIEDRTAKIDTLNAALNTNIETLKAAKDVEFELDETVNRIIRSRAVEAEVANQAAEATKAKAEADALAAEAEKSKLDEKILRQSEYYAFIGDLEQAALEKSLEDQAQILESTNLTEEQKTAIAARGAEERALIKEQFAKQEEEALAKSVELFGKTFDQLTAAERKTVLDATDEQKKLFDSLNASLKGAADQGAKAFGQLFKGLTDGSKDAKSSFNDMMGEIVKGVASQAFKTALSLLFPGGAVAGVATGFLGGLFGFASGGYTGGGSKHTPKGIVHAGEYVVKKERVTPQTRPALDRLNFGRHIPSRGGSSYANGGLVSPGGAPSGGNQVNLEINVSGLDAVDWENLATDKIVPVVERSLNDMNRSLF